MSRIGRDYCERGDFSRGYPLGLLSDTCASSLSWSYATASYLARLIALAVSGA